MDYEKAYNEMVKRAKELHESGNALTKQQMEVVCPELAESEDERIRKEIIKFLKECPDTGALTIKHYEDWLVWLEKQKEPHYIKRNALFDKCVENCEPATMKRVSDEVDAMLEKEQKPNIELIQKSWYMEGYHDRYYGKEPKWVIKTGDGGPKYEENPKYGQRLKEDQEPAECITNEEMKCSMDEVTRFKVFAADLAKQYNITHNRDIDWHNFCAVLLTYLEWNKPAEWSEEDKDKLNRIYRILPQCVDCRPRIIGDKECVELQDFLYSIAKNKQEWDEEDEKMRNECIMALSNWRDAVSNYGHEVAPCQRLIDWLKSIRPQPHWKPSEEQICELFSATIPGCDVDYNVLRTLYADLKKLMKNHPRRHSAGAKNEES